MKLKSADFYCRSSEDMWDVADSEVSLTVTSPPYWNSIDYNIHANSDDNDWHRTRRYGSGYADYLDMLTRVFADVYRVTKPGGFCGIVIGTVLLNGKHTPLPFDITAKMVLLGWEFHQDFIWHKTTAGVSRAGLFIQKPYPGYYYPNIMTEYILVFRKAGPKIYERSAESRETDKQVIDALFKLEVANNIWHIAPVTPGTLKHPCPFPEEIPYRLISLYSYRGDTVLDPFVGSGQTTKVAAALGRKAIGYDVEQKYVDYAASRHTEPIHLRSKQLTARFDKIDFNSAL